MFKQFETEEEYNAHLDEVLSGRISKALADERAKYEGYATPENVADYEKRIKGLTAKKAELENAVKRYEHNELKSKVARESGLRYELAGRLVGDTEEELRADAKRLVEYTAVAAPLKTTETAEDSRSAAYRAAANAMFSGEQ